MEIRNKIYSFEEFKAIYCTYIHHPDDRAFVEKAFHFADQKHEGQVRKSGDPYISHCVGVAVILAELQCGPQTLAAGLLHDTIEDTGTTKEEIEEAFGSEVATLVEALTKVTRLSDYKNVEFTAENHRKIFVAMAKDVRVIVIKLADRLHNMRTLQFQPEAKQQRISKETLEVYEPIAHRLGLYTIQTELENLSLWYLERKEYIQIENKVKSIESDAHQSLDEVKGELVKILQPTQIPFSISDRVKSVYSIYKKMHTKNYTFDQIYDLMALRIITETEQQCYAILGYVHANFKPMPGRFKDYIAMPKPNLYQSLHTTIISSTGHVFEIQIRTKAMDEIAEGGIAAHWRYKENSKYDPRQEQVEIENHLHWFKDFVSIANDNQDESTSEFVESLSHDIFDANVYVFTPKGNVICLPNGATPLDFAYRIHSDVGEHLQGAKVNSVLVPISQTLKTGDIVEVLTNKDSHPNTEWLNIAQTNFAKSKIRKYLVHQNEDYIREDAIKKGRQALLDSFRERQIKDDISKALSKKVLQAFKCNSADDLFYMLNAKTVTVQQIIDASDIFYSSKVTDASLQESINSKQKKTNTSDSVVLENGDSIMISLANCCTPIPGDNIVGFVSQGQGVKVHRKDCPNVNKPGVSSRLIGVKWNPEVNSKNDYPVDLAVDCHDSNNRLIEIVSALAGDDAKVTMIQAKLHGDITTVTMTLLAKDTDQLGRFMHTLTSVKGVFQIRRLTH